MVEVAQRGNLDSHAKEAQLRVGLIALAMALVVVAFLARSDAAPFFRAVVFLPFLVATNGVLAAFYGTCGLTALAGHRRTTDGAEVVADRAELAAHRRTGAWVLSL